MKRALRVSIAVLGIAAVLLTVWMARRLVEASKPSSSLGQTVQSAISNPVEFARNRITGGVGLMLRMDSASSLPVVQGVAVGSPAEAAGLHMDDVILEVNGRGTRTQSLAQVVDVFRGLT